MDELLTGGVLDAIYKFGALPMLVFAVWVLWKKTEKMEDSIKALNSEQKTELRTHGEEIKEIHQNTINALNDITRASLK